MCGRGLPWWWVLPLEMLSTYTCYSPRVHVIACCIDNGSCTCHLLIAQRGHLWFLHVSGLLDHVSGPCCSTCQFSTGTRVMLPLDHMSLIYWTMCRIFICPRVCFLFDHASRCCPSMCHIFIHPCGLIILFHVLDF
jgi:hypothetical protein